jgi:putative glutamine amidotransferase
MKHKWYFLLLALVLFVQCNNNKAQEPVRIGIAWRSVADSASYATVSRAIEEAGGIPVILGQVKMAAFEYDDYKLSDAYLDQNEVLLQEYADLVKNEPENGFAGCNAAQVVEGMDAVIFSGGQDIAPTLFRVPEPWHGLEEEKNFNATRDISEYLTMAYCLDQDIPLLGLCRGMQMLGVVSGASLIQDIPAYYEQMGLPYNYNHRQKAVPGVRRDYMPHDVLVLTHDSWIYKIAQTDTIHKVPSWHHQAVAGLDSTALKMTASFQEGGIVINEAIERTDQHFALGVQFHPEVAVRKHLEGAGNASDYMDYEAALAYFRTLVQEARATRDSRRK